GCSADRNSPACKGKSLRCLRKGRFSYIDTSPALSARRHLTDALRPSRLHLGCQTHQTCLLRDIFRAPHCPWVACCAHQVQRCLKHVHALRSRERGCFLVVQTLWAEKIQSTTDAGSLNTFGRNEIEVAPISSALFRIACLVILYTKLSVDKNSQPMGYQTGMWTRARLLK